MTLTMISYLHDLVHHQAHFTFLVEDALVVEGEEQGQGDLLDQLAESLSAAVQLPIGHQAGEPPSTHKKAAR